jgi:hypothetical protein
MDDIKSKLSELLNDPESLGQLSQMAETLFSGENSSDGDGSAPKQDFPDMEQLGNIMAIISKLNGSQDNDRTRLINALKPYLSEKRQAKAENAIKLLKIMELWPLIKESGMFNL